MLYLSPRAAVAKYRKLVVQTDVSCLTVLDRALSDAQKAESFLSLPGFRGGPATSSVPWS